MVSSLLFSTLALLAPPTTATDGDWIADWDEAAKVATDTGKDLLVDFTGSDWCGWCIKLHDEVFAHEEFLKGVNDDYVLVALDFPNDEKIKAKVPNPKRNQELQEKYGIRGFPTILLMTAEGEVFGKTGYQPGGPAAYLPHLAELRTKGKAELTALHDLETKLAAAQGPAKEKLLDEAIAKLAAQEEGSAFVDKLAALAKQAIATDPDNKAGRKLKAIEALLKAGIADDDVSAAARALDPKNEKGLLERVVNAEGNRLQNIEQVGAFVKKVDELVAFGPLKDKELAFQLCLNAAFFNHQHLKNPEGAKKYARMVQASGHEINDRVKPILKQILGE